MSCSETLSQPLPEAQETSPLAAKPWLSFEDQLEKLMARRLQVKNHDQAIKALAQVGYYRLTTYLKAFKDPAEASSGDHYLRGTYLEDAMALYAFDKRLRLLLLDALETIELSLRTDVAYVLGKRGGALAHRDGANFSEFFSGVPFNYNGTRHDKFLDEHKNCIARSGKKSFVQHTLDTYGDVPIWVATEFWDLGLVIHAIRGLKNEDALLFVQKYGLRPSTNQKVLHDYLFRFQKLRNDIAHHNPVCELLLSPDASKDATYNLSLGHELLHVASVIQLFLKNIEPKSDWGQRFIRLVTQDFPEPSNHAITLSSFIHHPDWHQAALWSYEPRENERIAFDGKNFILTQTAPLFSLNASSTTPSSYS